MGVTYLTNDQFANNRGYANFSAFAAAGNSDLTQSTLNIFRDRMYAIINKYIGAAVSKDNFLMNLEYQGVEMMEAERQARAAGEARDFYAPHDYLYERDRRILDAYDRTLNRGVTSG